VSSGFQQKPRQVIRARQAGEQQQVARQENSHQQLQLARDDLAEERALEEDETVEEVENSEPQDEELLGDSDRFLGDPQSQVPFDKPEITGLCSLSDLPSRARPLVRYRIDADFNVHPVHDERVWNASSDDLRKAIVQAVARFLQEQEFRFEECGDWCHLPWMDATKIRELAVSESDSATMKKLCELRGDKNAAKDDIEKLRKKLSTFARRLDDAIVQRSKAIRSFAIMLPNDDVVSVNVLTGNKVFANKDKAATRCGALRFFIGSPTGSRDLAGDTWAESEVQKFKKAQKRKPRSGELPQ